MNTYTFHQYEIQPNMLESLVEYVEHGRPVGGFLTAVLENNLSEAVGRADEYNMANLPAFCAYLYNEVPGGCHGSPAKVKAWYARFRAAMAEVEAI